MNLGTILSCECTLSSNKNGGGSEDNRLSFLEFNNRVNRLANALLAAGAGKGVNSLRASELPGAAWSSIGRSQRSEPWLFR